MKNCFISYHHAKDQESLDTFRYEYALGDLLDYSLKEDIGDYPDEFIFTEIRDKMSRCSVTIVLIGEETGNRKWIDWEIWATLKRYTNPKETNNNFKPNGLVAMFLPNQKTYNIPERLKDNIDSGYAVSLNWNENNFDEIVQVVEQAYKNREEKEHLIRNERPRVK